MYRGFNDSFCITATRGQEIEGRSGNPLYIENTSFRLRDGQPLRRLSISRPHNSPNQGILTANLFTNTGEIEFYLFPSYYVCQGKNKTLVKHPDLFALDFVRFAIKTFTSERLQIDQLNCHWTPNTTNHNVYMCLRSIGFTEMFSADCTWTGRNIAKSILGFQCINVEESSHLVPDIRAKFSR